MASLSEQVREIVNRSSASRYAVSRKIGVSEALLSRFLSGECGVSLATLDKLADVFGIVAIEGTLQQLPRPSKRGRKPKEKPMTTTVSKTRASKELWKMLASAQAEEMHEENFQSRCGIYEITDAPTKSGSVVCLYNNRPYALDAETRECAKRNEETKRLRSFLKQQGIVELAYETYPLEGENAGYTYAMILDATGNDFGRISGELARIKADVRADRSTNEA
jgi:transcriptional regulator with XRE-family HTH domain